MHTQKETRLRAADKLLCNLQAVDSEKDAATLGFDFPGSQTRLIEEALAAFSRLSQPVEEEEEEEAVTHEDEFDEEEEEEALNAE